MFEARQWSAAPTPKPARQRTRAPRTATAKPVQQPSVQPQTQPQAVATPAVPNPVSRFHASRSPLPTTPQALRTTYASRLRTGTTLLMQPILASSSSNVPGGRTGTRRCGLFAAYLHSHLNCLLLERHRPSPHRWRWPWREITVCSKQRASDTGVHLIASLHHGASSVARGRHPCIPKLGGTRA